MLLSIAFCSCKKVSEDEQSCINIANTVITHNSPVTIGQNIEFSTPEVGGYRIYSWIGPNNYISQYPEDYITDAELKHEGRYYLNLYSLTGDCKKIDSFYMDVKLKQGSPSCTVANNTTSFNNLSNDSYTSVIKGIEPIFSKRP